MNTTDTEADELVRDYLAQLRSMLRRVPRDRRRQILAEIAEHIDEGRAHLPPNNALAVQSLLERLGSPAEIAASADGDPPGHRLRRAPVLIGVGLATAVALGAVLWTGPFVSADHPSDRGRPASSHEASHRQANGSTASTVPASTVPATTSTTLIAPTATAPTSTTTVPTVSAMSAPPSGIYSGGPPGTPHYFITLTSSPGGLEGSVDFLYQDGQTSVVFTFHGAVQGSVATLTVDSSTAVGSAAPAPGSVPSVVSAAISPGAIELGECTTYLPFATSLAQCTFAMSTRP